MAKAGSGGQHFLPDFGSFKVAIRIIVLAVLIAAVVTLGRNDVFGENAWQDLNLLIGFGMVLALISVLVLKLFSPVIQRMTVRTGSLLAFLLLLAVMVVGTEVMVFALLRPAPDPGTLAGVALLAPDPHRAGGPDRRRPRPALPADGPPCRDGDRAPSRRHGCRRCSRASARILFGNSTYLIAQPDALRPGARRDRAAGPGRPVPGAARRCPASWCRSRPSARFRASTWRSRSCGSATACKVNWQVSNVPRWR
ncbi:MAG: hypothetical protein MZV65_52745 [Chromatiales bacterium]|nr:hypothetical protein [Chromatiales bacterium]